MMRRFFTLLWLLFPVGVIYYHYNAGQAQSAPFLKMDDDLWRRVLDTNLRASRDRFEVGDVTRTDVAQSEARLRLAQAQLQSAQANLIGSRENYVRLVGVAPGTLEVIPLGGLGEFGMNMMAVSWDETTILIDAGVMFPDPDQLGVDLIIPDLTYLESRRAQLKAVLQIGRASCRERV